MVVARRSDLLDLNKEAVLITVDGNGLHMLEVPARFAFDPKLLARATPVRTEARSLGLGQAGLVHPRHHQDLAVGRILDNRGNQSVFIELEVGQRHEFSGYLIGGPRCPGLAE